MITKVSQIKLNKELELLYKQNWDNLSKSMTEFPGLSKPYLAWVHPDYEKADVRLVVVGKETNGWEDSKDLNMEEPENSIQYLMDVYKDFSLGVNYSKKAAFWSPAHELYRLFNPEGPKFGFVALNASKMDQNGRIPSDAARDVITSMGLLKEEINILRPDVVIFHTGPRYDSWLKKYYIDLEIKGDMFLSRLKSNSLPTHSYRSYHPQYLNRKSKRKFVYDQILNEYKIENNI